MSLLLTLGLVAGEAVAGWLANSLALLTDAAHNLTDALALGLTWYALRLESKPAHAGKTFGYHRGGILVALLNSTTLVVISGGIFFEAYRRFSAPEPVTPDLMIAVGAVALIVNALSAWLVSHGAHHDLNLRSAFLHLMGDVVSTLGAILAGAGIYFTGYRWLDPLAGVLIGVLILWSAWVILRETIDILMESAPADVDMGRLVDDVMHVDGVRGVHDLHVWSISRQVRVLCAHVVVDDMPLTDAARIQAGIVGLARERYAIRHCTLQVEAVGCDPDHLFCKMDGSHAAPGQHDHAHHEHDHHH